jgi:hypothetical protein
LAGTSAGEADWRPSPGGREGHGGSFHYWGETVKNNDGDADQVGARCIVVGRAGSAAGAAAAVNTTVSVAHAIVVAAMSQTLLFAWRCFERPFKFCLLAAK